MWISSSVLAEMLEASLFALRTPSEEALAPLVEKARRFVADATTSLGRDPKAVDKPSYDLGVATVFVELLGTAEQRSEIEDALASLRRRSWGQSLLHEIALIEQNASPVKQGELARELKVDSGNLSRRIQELISLGLVERRNAGRPGTLFALTPLGRDLLDDVMPGWQAIHPRSGKVFESDEAAVKASSALVDSHLREALSARMRDFPAVIHAAMHALHMEAKASRASLEFGGIRPVPPKSWVQVKPLGVEDEVILQRSDRVLRPVMVSHHG